MPAYQNINQFLQPKRSVVTDPGDEFSDPINDPVRLASMRDQRMSEMAEQGINAQAAVAGGDQSSRPDALRKLLFSQKLQADIDADPYTGVREQAQTDQIEDAQHAGTVYNLPETRDIREQEQGFALEKATMPGRQMLEGKRIEAQGRVDAARERNQGSNRSEMVVPTLDPVTQKQIWTRRSEAPGKQTPGSSGERAAVRSNMNALAKIDNFEALADKVNWQGIGPAGGVMANLKKYTGIGNMDEDNMRVALENLRADIMFGEGGKALTESEKRIAAGYIADIYTDPTTAKSRMQQLRHYMEIRYKVNTGQDYEKYGLAEDPPDYDDPDAGTPRG